MDALVTTHSILRWIVLLAGVVALGVALAGWLGSGVSESQGRRTMLIYAISVDIQVLLGIVVYLLGNHWENPIRLIRLEHPILMIGALIVTHIAAGRARRLSLPAAARTRAIGAGVSLLLIIAGIPWNRL